MVKNTVLLGILFLLINCSAEAQNQIKIAQAFPNLSFDNPVDIQNCGDGSNRLFIVSQPGVIYVTENNPSATQKNIFLDLRDRVTFGGEMGLLGLAFHPNFKTNGYFYVNYTADNPRRTIISRFKVSDTNINLAEKSGELILLTVSQPYSNHNGGQTLFGPDGYLYISLGDGGSGGDPQNNAQNNKSLLGKILRINVDKKEGNLNYSIPDDNPFKGNNSGFREEIYAWGLRNVWRFSFDSSTKELWGADVGQNAIEEINIIKKGGNYGWRCYEGNRIYNSNGCNASNYISPIFEYGHDSDGGYSITGGYVYRGTKVSELIGKYIYADFVTSHIWALEYKNSQPINTRLFKGVHSVSTFGVDENSELYFANYSNGRIYKFEGTPVSKVGEIKFHQEYRLHQNYPNPFNPETQISYQIPADSHVTIKIFDLLGKEVQTLVNEFKRAGNYYSTFSSGSNNISSGVYIYNITAGAFSDSKKMLLLE